MDSKSKVSKLTRPLQAWLVWEYCSFCSPRNLHGDFTAKRRNNFKLHKRAITKSTIFTFSFQRVRNAMLSKHKLLTYPIDVSLTACVNSLRRIRRLSANTAGSHTVFPLLPTSGSWRVFHSDRFHTLFAIVTILGSAARIEMMILRD